MNKKREPYDRIAVGERIRHKRIQLGLSQDELAVRINRATKYCSDIERGMCGMSVETMLAIAKSLDMNLDYMMFGEISETEREWQQKDAMTLIHIIEQAHASQRNYAIRLLKLFIAATGNSPIDPFFFTTSGTVRKSIFTSSPRLQFKKSIKEGGYSHEIPSLLFPFSLIDTLQD